MGERPSLETLCSRIRSFFHLLVNFNRIWILHISVFWYYTA